MSQRRSVVFLSFLLLSKTLAAGPLPGGQVELSLPQLEQMLSTLEADAKPARPHVEVCPIDRQVDGELRKGLFRASLRARFEVLGDPGHLRVPVLDSAASLTKVTLDGKRTSLQRDGELYSVGVDSPGVHEIKLGFYLGQEQDRFTRNLRFRLPAAGSSAIRVMIPEQDIFPSLVGGALDPVQRSAGGSLVSAHLDAKGLFDLSWKRRINHKENEKVRLAMRLNTLLTASEALISGVASFDVDILEGETDHIALQLEKDLEILGVDGPAVLQWYTESQDGSQLSVLLRHLVDDHTKIVVRFQFPVVSGDNATALMMPLPLKGVELRGNLGILAHGGLDLSVVQQEKVQAQTLRDLPAELTDLTSSPLALGFRFTEPPLVALRLGRLEEVELTSTIIDDLQASTVLLQDGSEITKLKLRMRNNTRQYLSLQLPPDTLLTHALIDGNPVRPARTSEKLANGGETLLFPLRQSERIGAGKQRLHWVQSGETLSDIANFYFADPAAWDDILRANRDQLSGPADLYPGQRLLIPTRGGSGFSESSFVIELAYKRQQAPLGSLGQRSLSLPQADVDVVKMTWHLYLPQAVLPLNFDANLTQYSAIRYDPFRRFFQFLQRAGWTRYAWAGSKSAYRSILTQRKDIYLSEQRRQQRGGVLTSFPLVGQRYRFKRLLPGHDRARIHLRYMSQAYVLPLRWLGLLLAFSVSLWLLWRRRGVEHYVIAAVIFLGLLVLAHYVLGVHRRLLWGVDLALLVAWLRLALPRFKTQLRQRLQGPWDLWGELRLGNFLALLGVWAVLSLTLAFPLFFSSISLLVLSLLWWRARLDDLHAAGKEVRHA